MSGVAEWITDGACAIEIGIQSVNCQKLCQYDYIISFFIFHIDSLLWHKCTAHWIDPLFVPKHQYDVIQLP